MDEKIKSFVQEINDALTEDALDYLYNNGDDYILSDAELSKLFTKKFMHRSDYPESDGLCLVYDKNYEGIELFSLRAQMRVWIAKCDIQNVQSIIDSTIECLNNCMKEGELNPYKR